MFEGRPIDQLLAVMAELRSPTGCPWDREQNHRSLRYHAVEEVYELMDAIDRGDDQEMAEELGDLLLQVVFHCQLARERGAYDFDHVCRLIVEKLIRRHPHVFGDSEVKTVEGVWTQWERIKHAEKEGTRHARASVMDGIPRHLPALLRAEKLAKKARKAGLAESEAGLQARVKRKSERAWASELYEAAAAMQRQGKSAESALRSEVQRRERMYRRQEERRRRGGAGGRREAGS